MNEEPITEYVGRPVVRMGYSLEKKPESSPAGRRPEGIPAALRDHAKRKMAQMGMRVPPANSTRKNRGKNGGFCGGAPGRDANLYSDLSKPSFGERGPMRDTSKVTGQK